MKLLTNPYKISVIMARLTEEMVIARSKQSDLAAIKKLNCWGSELVDVTLLRRMPNVEVLALSINNISSLADFAHCSRLQELYVRKNNIRDLTEIKHLANLDALSNLWLEENPCADEENYRMTVLRALPRLQKLDNVSVQPEEVQEALRKGIPILDEEEYYEDQETFEQYRCPRSDDSSPDRLQERPDVQEYSRRGDQGSDCSDPVSETYTYSNGNGNRDVKRSSPQQQSSPTRQRCYSPSENEDGRYKDPPAARHQAQYYDRSPPTNAPSEQITSPRALRHANSIDETVVQPVGQTAGQVNGAGIRHSQSAQSVKEYNPTNGEQPGHRHHAPHYSRHSADFTSRDAYSDACIERNDPYQRCPADSDRSERESIIASRDRLERDRDSAYHPARGEQIPSAVMADHRGFTRRPVTRNSNLLSAVLCLVKELDYPSLEVAEMAVRCRMDELANNH